MRADLAADFGAGVCGRAEMVSLLTPVATTASRTCAARYRS